MSVTITAKKVSRANNPQPLNELESGIVRTNVFNPVIDDLESLSAALDVIQPSANTLVADTISEATAAAGVTVDGLLIKDGGFLTTKSNVTQGTSKTTTVVTSANAGTITTVALSDAAAGTFNFTVTNPLALATSNIQLTVSMNGSTGIAYVTHTKGAGSFVITVTNIAPSAAFNAAIKIDYLIS